MNSLSPSFESLVPEGDDRPRRVCAHCTFVDYQNPKIVAGAVCVADDLILLCKRAINPRRGYWTVPAGFMELGECVDAAAVREAREEASADIVLDGLVGVYSVSRIGQVHMMFRARLLNEARAGDETTAVKMVKWDDIDWDELAFPTVRWALEDWKATESQSHVVPAVRGDPPPIKGEWP